MNDLELLISSRVITNNTFAECERTLRFKEQFDLLKKAMSEGHLKRLKIEKHVGAILNRLMTLAQLGREASYAELRKAISPPLRNKFEIAIIELRKYELVTERISFGKCFYRLNCEL